MCTRIKLLKPENISSILIRSPFERKLSALPYWRSPKSSSDFEELNAKLESAKILKDMEETPTIVLQLDDFIIGKTRYTSFPNNEIVFEFMVGQYLNGLGNPIFIRSIDLIKCYTSEQNIEEGKLICLSSSTDQPPIHLDIVIVEFFDGLTLEEYMSVPFQSIGEKILNYTRLPYQEVQQMRSNLLDRFHTVISIICYTINTFRKVKFTHYDLNLGNILINSDNKVAIIDFATSYVPDIKSGYTTASPIVSKYGMNPNVYDPYFDSIYLIKLLIEFIGGNYPGIIRLNVTPFEDLLDSLHWLSFQQEYASITKSIEERSSEIPKLVTVDRKQIKAMDSSTIRRQIHMLKFTDEFPIQELSLLISCYKQYEIEYYMKRIDPDSFLNKINNILVSLIS